MWLRQSTASQEILLGRFVDSTDGNTEVTGLTIANTDIKLWVEGSTTLANKNSGGATHIANGMYYAVLDETDTATLGKLEINVHVAGALSIRREFMVLPAMVYDSLVLGTDVFQSDVTQWTGVAAVLDGVTSLPVVQAKLGESGGEQGLNLAGIDYATNGYFSAYVTNIDAGVTGSTFTAIPWNAAWDAEVQSEVQDAIEVNHLDHLLAVAAAGTECANSTYWARLVSKSATPAFSSYVNTTDSLEALRDRGDAAWITATGFSTLDAAGVRTAVGLASANLDTQLDALPTAVENADALLGRNIAGGSSTGRTVSTALYVLRNKVTISAGTMTVYQVDDTTSSWTATMTSDAAANPITSMDPG